MIQSSYVETTLTFAAILCLELRSQFHLSAHSAMMAGSAAAAEPYPKRRRVFGVSDEDPSVTTVEERASAAAERRASAAERRSVAAEGRAVASEGRAAAAEGRAAAAEGRAAAAEGRAAIAEANTATVEHQLLDAERRALEAERLYLVLREAWEQEISATLMQLPADDLPPADDLLPLSPIWSEMLPSPADDLPPIDDSPMEMPSPVSPGTYEHPPPSPVFFPDEDIWHVQEVPPPADVLCPICLDPGTECTLQCGHGIHNGCHLQMLAHSVYVCPICRAPLF